MKYLTASEMRTFQRCQRKWWLQEYRGMRKLGGEVQFNRPLGIGNRVHEALAAYYTPEDSVSPLEWLSRSRDEDLSKFPERQADILAECELAEIMLTGYVEWLAETGEDQALTVIEAEKAVVVPLEPGRDVSLLTKLDARVSHDEYGSRLALEHKGQPLDALVMTPSGPRCMGALRAGDTVMGADGAPTRVVGTYPLGERDTYRVSFSDETSLLVTEDHVWSTSLGVMTTAAVRDRQHRRMKIPRCGPAQFNTRPLPVDPYTLGVLLGDGMFTVGSIRVGVTESDQAVIEALRDVAHVKTLAPCNGWKSMLVATMGRETLEGAKALGLYGLHSYDKFVPVEYLHSSTEQRLALLQGLMDSNGSVGPQARYTTTSEQLIKDVQFLVESFGGTLKIKGAMGHVGTRAAGYDTRAMWYGTAQGLSALPLHRLARKQVYRDQVQERGRTITSVVRDGSAECQCIKVDAADGLYVTEHFIVTHNTTGAFSQLEPELRINPQALTEHLAEYLHLLQTDEDPETAQGVLFNMLRKVKRTAKANPPFYKRVHVRHTKTELRNHWYHVVALADQIKEATRRLDAGESHQTVVPPAPMGTCAWQCQFFQLCPMFDAEQDAEMALLSKFIPGNSLERYDGLLDAASGASPTRPLPDLDSADS
jgi:hypothetical protein